MDPQRLQRPKKSEFAKLCRQLRLEHGLKQREVAAVAGVAATTYGNVESSAFKVISRPRAERIANHYKLSPAQQTEFLAAWERCPLSAYGERRREGWARRDAVRAKLKQRDVMHMAFLEFIAYSIPHLPPSAQCRCEFGGGTSWDPTRNCDMCYALEAVGIPEGWEGPRRTMKRLSEIVTTLDLKFAAAAAYAAKFKKGSTNGKPT
ncbi:MAG TPA: helix-turn-helix domain-containing protein [Gemmatimonadaceae bacterium]|nr:helix-turn-helix domain-containing protein [Gemmatimonadaceae bacterium]